MTLPRSSVQLGIAAVAWCGDYGRPTLFKIAIACGFKLTEVSTGTWRLSVLFSLEIFPFVCYEESGR